ncbi:hypothetical protein Ccar_01125 [Clostridium carboxidivorans P7]|nr:DUF4367 domain-containing protein [Clostridium carboxidivorans]AKN29516.1 hypothetical protein Ccar_01125 [Clostridium carboxidivorans P7]EFG89559.1 hypothetical protein CLCAR_0723 [Clostridium carboxidivorans P7]
MKDNMEYFKEASNLLLKDIYATEKLKKMTLEKCKSQKKNRIKPILAMVASAAFLIIGFTYNYFFNNSTIPRNYVDNNAQQYKNSNDSGKIKESSTTKSNNDLAKSVNDSSKNKGESGTSANNKPDDKATKSNTNTTNSVDSITGSKDSSGTSTSGSSTQNSLAPSENFSGKESYKGLQGIASPQKNLDMATAEKYFESKIITPSYIPDGFNLTDISIPDAKLKCIKLKYSSDSSYFEIYESKNLSNLDGSKTVYINSNKAYINYMKDSKSATTQIVWINNNVQYYLSSTLPEDSLINIAKSIN